MKDKDKHISAILGEIGCKFRSNIENHIKDDSLRKDNNVEWLLEPLDEISHRADYVLDAFQISTRWESIYELYFHLKNATSIYIPFDKPINQHCGMRKEGNTISFDDKCIIIQIAGDIRKHTLGFLYGYLNGRQY